MLVFSIRNGSLINAVRKSCKKNKTKQNKYQQRVLMKAGTELLIGGKLNCTFIFCRLPFTNTQRAVLALKKGTLKQQEFDLTAFICKKYFKTAFRYCARI